MTRAKRDLIGRIVSKAAICLAGALLSGCLGEIQQAHKELTEGTRKEYAKELRFDGILEAVPISNSKIEIYFSPARGGSLRYSYLVYVGNQPNPISVTEEVLAKDYRGLFRYTIEGLEIGTQYSIKVDVYDTVTKEVLSTENSLAVYTFSNHVADFHGISAVFNAQGEAGVDSVRVRWAHPVMPGGIFTNGEGPKTYEIILIDSERLTPSALDQEDLGPEDGRLTRYIEYNPTVTETIVRGLREGTTYYVAVRCIHENSFIDPNKPNLKGEKNHRYLEIKTLTMDAANLEFDPEEFKVESNHGELATSSLIVNWGEFVGPMDHFRIFYAKSPYLSAIPGICAQGGGTDLLLGHTFCKKAPISASQSLLTDLLPQAEHQVQLVACLDSSCSKNVQLPIRAQKTTTALATFTGLEEVQLAKDLLDIGKVFLQFTPPDLNTGYFDGLAVGYTPHRNDLQAYLIGQGPMPETFVLEQELSGGHNLTFERFDYLLDTEIAVDGIDYTAESNHCFALYPFNYSPSSDDGREYYMDNAQWKCVKVEVIPPSSEEFGGVLSAQTIDNDLVVNWDVPTGGIYSHFEIFYRKVEESSNHAFSFEDAAFEADTFQEGNYARDFIVKESGGVDGNGDPIIRTSHSLQNIDNGYYNIGVRSYYNAGVGKIKRSEENEAVFQCHVTGANILADCIRI